MYSPSLARFVSADTIAPNPINPQSLNRYSYAYNQPCRYNDPSGHCGEPDTWNTITADELSACYLGQTGHIDWSDRSSLSVLAEALWRFSQWLGSVEIFRQVMLGHDGLQTIRLVNYQTRNPETLPPLEGSPGVYLFVTGELLISTAGGESVGIVVHELAHVLQDGFPTLYAEFARTSWHWSGGANARDFDYPGGPHAPHNEHWDYSWQPRRSVPPLSYPDDRGVRNMEEQMAQAVCFTIMGDAPTARQQRIANNWADLVWSLVVLPAQGNAR